MFTLRPTTRCHRVTMSAAVTWLLLLGCKCSQGRSLSAQASGSCHPKIFWFMATTTSSSLGYWRLAKIALLSAKESSPNLVPVLIYGGVQDAASPEALDNIVWFREHGGIVYHHNLTFGPDLQRVVDKGLRDSKWIRDVEGTYMRLDIPVIMPHLLKQLEERKPGSTKYINQELALYTDADVMFYHEMNPCQVDKPEIMAIGPEMDRDKGSWEDMNKNSGVLLINLKGLSEVLPAMMDYSNEKDWDFKVTDQSLINEYFPKKDIHHRVLDRLSDAYNWKGYWGCSPRIVITHWHGPKPERCMPCFVEHRSQYAADKEAHVTGCKCPAAYNELWRRAMEGDGGGLYAKMMSDQAEYDLLMSEPIATDKQ
ncbi:hypothetical protein ABBQ38_008725 [Trebouxia sp. C0009 RCD-2024]